MGATLQFIGKEQVEKAFENMEVDFWAIFQNKQFMFKGQGMDELSNVLQMLEGVGAASVYTLKIYEDVKTKSGIKSNTPDDGSFNFRLAEPLEANMSGLGMSMNSKLLQTLSGIDERLKLLEDTEPEPEPGGGLGRIGVILENPALQPIISQVLERVMGALLPPAVSQNKPMAALSGINDDIVIMEIINKLKVHDPQILAHLQKLLSIAETNPELFKALITNL